MEIALKTNNQAVFKYLWADHPELWDFEEFKLALERLIEVKETSLLSFVLSSKTSRSIFQSLSYNFRSELLHDYILKFDPLPMSMYELNSPPASPHIRKMTKIEEAFKMNICE